VLLTIDAGNTQTVVGLYRDDDLVEPWRLSTNAERTSDEHALLFRQLLDLQGSSFADLSGIVFSSTVPRLTATLREMAERYFPFQPVVVEPGTKTGMPILIENPKELGPDRIANAVGAYDRYAGPVIIVDFGTSTNLDVASAQGEYLGGAIMPGVEVSLDALFARAAALSRIKLAKPRRAIGRSTVEAVQSGTLFGFAGAVDALCRRFQAELGGGRVIATGGLGELMTPYTDCVERHDPWLTLHGLRLIYERNQ
jgi:type III pantothenate kinase